MATVLTQVGEEWIIDKLDVATKADYVGWGTGAGTAVKGSTALVSILVLVDVALEASDILFVYRCCY